MVRKFSLQKKSIQVLLLRLYNWSWRLSCTLYFSEIVDNIFFYQNVPKIFWKISVRQSQSADDESFENISE